MPSNLRATTSFTTILLQRALIVLAGLTRSGGFAAADHKVLILGKVNNSQTLQDASFGDLSILDNEMTRSEATSVIEDQLSFTNAKKGAKLLASFGCRRALSELMGAALTTAIAITLANSWKSGRKKSSPAFEANEKVDNGMEVAHKSTHDVENTCQQVASQAELDWIDEVRTGAVRLTDDIFSTAMQWWLDQPLSSTLARMGSQDQRLLKPVAELLEQGRREEGTLLMEQIGQLDKMERELQRKARPIESQDGNSSPLARNSSSLLTSACLLRGALESYTPTARRAYVILPIGPPTEVVGNYPEYSPTESYQPLLGECSYMPVSLCGA